MATPYSLDLRLRILNDYDGGVPVDDIVTHYAVSRSWFYSLLQRRRETGQIAPRPPRPGRKQKLAPYEQEVRQLVADHPDATLDDFVEWLSPHVSIGRNAVCNFLHRLKITRKKRLSTPPNNIGQQWSNNVKNGKNFKKSSTSKNSFSLTKPGRKRT